MSVAYVSLLAWDYVSKLCCSHFNGHFTIYLEARKNLPWEAHVACSIPDNLDSIPELAGSVKGDLFPAAT
jgi:hypothetical protein